MGRMKELAMDYDEAFDVLISLRYFLDRDTTATEELKRESSTLLDEIENRLEECKLISNTSAPTIILGLLKKILTHAHEGKPISQYRFFKIHLMMCSTQLEIQLMSKQTVMNSQEYYEDEIKDLKQNISSLENEISSLREKNTKNASLLDQKESILSQQNVKLLELEKDRDELIRREDARRDWSRKITEAFSNLKKGLEPIKLEKKRLNWMYFIYGFFCIVLIGLLVAIEIIMTGKLNDFDGIPPLNIYISLLAPIPGLLALLFVFISQINRTQRQLVAISKYIHDIEYTEEIMQSINSLSVNIEDSMKRINGAIDKLLERHLSCDLNYLEEAALQKQEDRDKDTIPVGQVTDIIKEILKSRS